MHACSTDSSARSVTPKPSDTPTSATLTNEATWGVEAKSWGRKKESQSEGQAQACTISKDQCAEHVKEKIKQVTVREKIKHARDLVNLGLQL